MAQISRFEGAVREAEIPLARALAKSGYAQCSSERDVLLRGNCGLASNVLRVHLGRLGFDAHNMKRSDPSHVLIHHEDEGADATHLQFLSRIGVSSLLARVPGVYDQVLDLLPERKIAVYDINDSSLFGESVVRLALELKPKLEPLLVEAGVLLESSQNTNDQMAGSFLPYYTDLMTKPDEQIDEYYRTLWDTKEYTPFPPEVIAEQYKMSAAVLQDIHDMHETIADAM